MVSPTWVGSPNHNTQNRITKRHITLHWMVGTLASTDIVFQRKGGVSATYGIEDSKVHQYVQEKDYPYSDGNTYSNTYGISIEHAGGWIVPGGGRFKPTQATHETSAQLCADIARRHKFGKLIVGVNIFPHNHWASTMCPGSLDVAWIAARANAINDGTAGGDPTPIPPDEENEDDMIFSYFSRTNPKTKKPEYAITHPLIFADGVFITTDVNIASGFAPYTRNSAALTDDRWEAMIRTAKVIYDAAWAAEARKAAMIPGGAGGSFTAEDRARLEAVPTAVENGQAARTAIVK